MLRSVHGYDSMDVQDVLMRNHWNAELAVDELKSRGKPAVKRTLPSVNHQNGNRTKKQRRDSDDGGDSDEGHEYSKTNVFDSDDSENEGYTSEMTLQRQEVYDFFNNANIGELTSIKACSLKKAEIITENRPYRNWEELVAKFQEKPLQTDLLNNCQEYLDKRNSLKKLMKKCKSIVLKLERAVAEEAAITQQPYTLNEGLKLSNYQMVSWRVVVVEFLQDF